MNPFSSRRQDDSPEPNNDSNDNGVNYSTATDSRFESNAHPANGRSSYVSQRRGYRSSSRRISSSDRAQGDGSGTDGERLIRSSSSNGYIDRLPRKRSSGYGEESGYGPSVRGSSPGGYIIGGSSNHGGDLISSRSSSGLVNGPRGAKREYWGPYGRPAGYKQHAQEDFEHHWSSKGSPSEEDVINNSEERRSAANIKEETTVEVPISEEKPEVPTAREETKAQVQVVLNSESPAPVATENSNSDLKVELHEDIVEEPSQRDQPVKVTEESDQFAGTVQEVELEPKSTCEDYPDWSSDEFPVADGCIFPMEEAPYRVWQLQCLSKRERRKEMKYFSPGHISDIHQYNFIDDGLLIFKQADGVRLYEILKEYHALLNEKCTALTEEYVWRDHVWRKQSRVMDKKVELIRKIENDIKKTRDDKKDDKKKKKEEDAIKAREQARKEDEERKQHARRARHHGDSVRTEAEFLDILASFEKERENDPMVRAQYGAATIPDMTLDPVQKYGLERFMDSNNRVKDKEAWAHRIEVDPIDNFTEVEHDRFCKAFALYPKKFGRISHYMGGLRNPEECVIHYYVTKKKVNYKDIVASRNKRGKKKSIKKKEKEKGKKEGESQTPDTSLTESPPRAAPGVDRRPTGRLLQSEQYGSKKLGRPTTTGASSPESDIPETPMATTPNVATPEADSGAEHEAETDSEAETEAEMEPEERVKGPESVEEHVQRVENGGKITEKVKVEEAKIEEPGVAETIAETSIKPMVTPQAPEATIESIAAALAGGHQMGPSTSTSTSSSSSKRSKRGRKRSRDLVEEEHRDKRKERGHKDKNHVTSYWSVQETSLFPTLLEQYGTDWDSIARSLSSKTSSMVRNYYQRGLGDNPQWREVAAAADAGNVESSAISPTGVATSVKIPSSSAPQYPYPGAGTWPAYKSSAAAPYEAGSFNSGPPAPAASAYQPGFNMMRMSSILNGGGTAEPSVLPPISSAPRLPLLAGSVGVQHKPTIMSLLNSDGSGSSAPPVSQASVGSATLPPLRPAVAGIIGQPAAGQYMSTVPGYPIQPGSFQPVQQTNALEQSISSSSAETLQTKPTPDQAPQRRGFSALEALAQVAFERE
ncbi:DEKNAAC101337 [Brettanomyces naardenensis]|uniref:DEKNAAC101337 n=1 Tax=Brettanomyces naardenensis TaxID=13370 RepID=A0A448YHZ2_BRENA|nr:DEKNAAC101337 [Brettanomyces naardenensis]